MDIFISVEMARRVLGAVTHAQYMDLSSRLVDRVENEIGIPRNRQEADSRAIRFPAAEREASETLD